MAVDATFFTMNVYLLPFWPMSRLIRCVIPRWGLSSVAIAHKEAFTMRGKLRVFDCDVFTLIPDTALAKVLGFTMESGLILLI